VRAVELKNVFVDHAARGRHLMRAVVGVQEQYAMDHGADLAFLKNSRRQEKAIAAYQGLGYRQCFPFGEYRAAAERDPSWTELNLCMAKELTSGRDVNVFGS